MTHPLTPREKVENALYSMEDWRQASPEYLIDNILAALASGSGDRDELAELREHRIIADLLVSTLKADKAEAERKLAEAVGHGRKLLYLVDGGPSTGNIVHEWTEAARTFLSKEAERG